MKLGLTMIVGDCQLHMQYLRRYIIM